jgi:two-component system chemotaxis response regulator CheB
VLVVQHLHPEFVGGLATWMARVSALPVSLAEHGHKLEAGHVYLGPGELHLRLAARRRIELSERPKSVHRPSADELFTSLAEHAGERSVGVVLTGMGDDGARGLLAIHEADGRTIAQDEASCAVFGMPRAAEKLGAVGALLPLRSIAASIVRAVRELKS